MNQKRPEIANSIQTGNFQTNYHDLGKGAPLVMLHGSGPGVTSWGNWNKVFGQLSEEFRVIAPDMQGFGFTERKENDVYNMNNWVQQTIDLFDALGIEKAHLVGNSFGGALALSMAIKYPERIDKLVLMGSMRVSFPLTYGLDRVWGYTPFPANMEELLEIFTYGFSKTSEYELIKPARRVVGNSKIAVLLIPGIGTIEDLKQARECGVEAVRVATHVTEADVSAEHIKAAKEMGLFAAGFLMMVHMASPECIAEEAKKMEE